ncbi:CHAP domain-containing protein [Haloactinomyces albus]|uniref:Peptidase C51 domain-containing protein n=1 Tax=Haloactinomyces albus TaxID=1352928 RepID=A0AAE4CQ54_9ACTN|nr:CHAP domain-containing protein [Haloactinomyces albus]MDR7302308.1 hypothetical protein [Haloactinomyces albus]
MQNDTDDTTSPEGRSPTGRRRSPFGHGIANIKSAWSSLLHHRGEHPDDTAARRVPRGIAGLCVAVTLSVAAVATAATMPPSSSGTLEGDMAAAPAITAQAGTVQAEIVQAARQGLGTEETGDNCQKYSDRCVAWCALFAMSTWEKAGVDVENEEFAFTGDVYTTGQAQGEAYGSDQLSNAKPGDVLLFGTGPENISSSRHIGVVERIEGDTVTLIEGNTGDNPDRVMRKEHELSAETFYGGVHPW